MAAIWLRLLSIYIPVLLFGCETKAQFDDLDQQMADFRRKADSTIDSLPIVPLVDRSSYTAFAMRSPFLPPVDAAGKDRLSNAVVLAPDQARSREPLEFFNYSALSMVGTLSSGQQIWALINDGEGGVHKVAKGNYMGRNYGEITQIDDGQLHLLETVPNNNGGWVYRQRLLMMAED